MGFCFHLTANSRLYSRIIFHFILSFVCLLLLGILFSRCYLSLSSSEQLSFSFILCPYTKFSFRFTFQKISVCFAFHFIFSCFFRPIILQSMCIFVSFCWWKCNFQLINTFLFWKIILGNTLLVSFPAELSICCYQTGPNLVAGGLTVFHLVSWLLSLFSFSLFRIFPLSPALFLLPHSLWPLCIRQAVCCWIFLVFHSRFSTSSETQAWTIFHWTWCGLFWLADNGALIFFMKWRSDW